MKRNLAKNNVSGEVHAPATSEVSANQTIENFDENSANDDSDVAGIGPRVDAVTSSHEASDPIQEHAKTASNVMSGKPMENVTYRRVKVKLKTSKIPESLSVVSDALAQSDTLASGSLLGTERKMEDSDISLPSCDENSSKKAASIKIKTSRGLNLSRVGPESDVGAKGHGMLQNEGSFRNVAELDASLSVIRKIMTMDAAEPFNAPVNPIALGIPDYFKVIETPMDFGTICSNIKNGVKYLNSKDVYKDVQYIWHNCYRYNNKGDYILDLLKRVKKSFTKYWAASGLYTEQSENASGVQDLQLDDATISDQERLPFISFNSKKKKQKRHGIKTHKDSCLCAVCFSKRRKQERIDNSLISNEHFDINDGNMNQEFKLKGASLAGSPCGEDSSLNMENSAESDADVDSEEKEVLSEQHHSSAATKHWEEKPTKTKLQDEELVTQIPKNGLLLIHPVPGTSLDRGETKKKLLWKCKEKMYQELVQCETPALVQICNSLFLDDRNTVWSGNHSLLHYPLSSRSSSSSIHKAISELLK